MRSRVAPTNGTSYAIGVPTVAAMAKSLPIILTKQGISEHELAKVYHHDGNAYNVIVSEVKEKSTAKKQIGLGLLLGMQSLLEGGEPVVSKDALVTLCKTYSVYDPANFASHMKKNKQLFLSKGSGWVLTVPGQQRAADVIKELAQ